MINKAAVRDRVMHHFVFKYLEKIYQPHFVYQSYPCQKGKGTHRAVKESGRALRKVEEYNEELVGECELNRSVQSYLGIIGHCSGYRLGQKLRNEVRVNKAGRLENF